MIISVTSSGNSINSDLDPRFGRCSYFVIFDLKTNEHSVIANSAGLSGGGAGVSSGQLMVENNVEAIITGNVGPNAMNVLKAAGIEIYKGENTSVNENIEKFKSGSLKTITDTVPSHFGMGIKGDK